MKRLPWFEAILIIIVLSASLYAAFSDGQNFPNRWFTRDDAYYYFKVAQNISEGRGSTFDGINPTNGYHPLWMLICIPIFALARIDLVLPLRVLLLVMSGLSVATAILLYRLLGKLFTPFVGALAALYWMFDTRVQETLYRQGLESGIAAFFIALLLYNLYDFETTWRKDGISQRRLVMLALLGVLTMFSRLDLVFFALLAGLWILFRGQTLRYYLPLDIISILFSVLLAFTLKFGFPDYFDNDTAASTMIIISAIVRLPLAFFLRLYQDQSNQKPITIVSRLALFGVIGSVLVGGLMLVIARVMNFNAMPRTILLMDAVLTFLFFGTIRFIHKDLKAGSSQPIIEQPLEVLKSHWKGWLTEGSVYYGIIVGLLGVYMLWNRVFIGTFSPVSGQIKRWWGTFLVNFYGKYPQDIATFFGVTSEKGGAAWMPVTKMFELWAQKLAFLNASSDLRLMLVILLAAICFYLVLRINKQKASTVILQSGILPLFAGCMLQIMYYNYTGYSAEKEWYWVGESLAIVLAGGMLIGMISNWAPAGMIKDVIGWILVIMVGYSSGMTFWTKTTLAMPYNRWQPDTPYVDIIPLLEANTETDSIIGMTGGGTTAYFIHDRTIVNMDGLINSKPYFESLQNRTAGEYLIGIGLDYVYANRYILSSQPYKGMFDPYLTNTGVNYNDNDLMKYGK